MVLGNQNLKINMLLSPKTLMQHYLTVIYLVYIRNIKGFLIACHLDYLLLLVTVRNLAVIIYNIFTYFFSLVIHVA